jgi:beta-lactamase class A
MLEMLLAQEFNNAIPAGLPLGTPVAHKTGEITSVLHDAAVIYPADRPSFVLVVLTKGYADRKEAERRVAQLAETAYGWAIRRPEPRE